MLRTRTTALFLLCLALAAPARADDVTVTLPAGDGFVLEDNTGTIEHLRVEEGTGNVSRGGALFLHTTGPQSVFLGQDAGSTASTGADNAAFGYEALAANTTGIRNAAFGARALTNNTTGNSNAAFGRWAMRNNVSGFDNSAFGHFALYGNTGGDRNSAFGASALQANSTGSDNTAAGNQALLFNSSGTENSAFGRRALRYNSSGNGNAAFGVEALDENTTGDDNAAFGHGALQQNTTGYGNVAVGANAGSSQTTGNNNIYIANLGVAGENGRIRIGRGGTHQQTFVAGIDGNALDAGTPVVVSAAGELGTGSTSLLSVGPVTSMVESCSTPTARVFCALSQVKLNTIISSGANSWCRVDESAGQWSVCARSNNTTAVVCDMRCF